MCEEKLYYFFTKNFMIANFKSNILISNKRKKSQLNSKIKNISPWELIFFKLKLKFSSKNISFYHRVYYIYIICKFSANIFTAVD